MRVSVIKRGVEELGFTSPVYLVSTCRQGTSFPVYLCTQTSPREVLYRNQLTFTGTCVSPNGVQHSAEATVSKCGILAATDSSLVLLACLPDRLLVCDEIPHEGLPLPSAPKLYSLCVVWLFEGTSVHAPRHRPVRIKGTRSLTTVSTTSLTAVQVIATANKPNTVVSLGLPVEIFKFDIMPGNGPIVARDLGKPAGLSPARLAAFLAGSSRHGH